MAPVAEPHLFVVLGATGDLAQRKLLPALFQIHRRGEMPAGSAVLGAARKPMSDGEFQRLAQESLTHFGGEAAPGEADLWCTGSLRFQSLGAGGPSEYAALAARVAAVEKEFGLSGNRVFYLALPLEAFGPTIEALGQAGLSKGPGWTRLVIEKPFGRDLESAVDLNTLVHRHFDEGQVYRIDHYLGKETVQNLLVLRFANMFVNSLWGRNFVEHVQITVAESLGLEGRAGYYEQAGALRDMVQNHVTQVLSLIAMEPPSSFEADAIRSEKVKALQSIRPLRPSDVVFGQYGPGKVDGAPVIGYQQEPGVAKGSTTETYVALRMTVANWRWQGVPFLVRTGKRLPAKATQVVLTLRAPPVSLFPLPEDYALNPDRLILMLQPDEGVEIAFEIKVPGRSVRLQTQRMRFHYADVFGPLSDGYETLLVDVMLGDATLFVRADEVEASWRLYDPVLSDRPKVATYPAGSDGPVEADQLAEAAGCRWYEPRRSGGS